MVGAWKAAAEVARSAARASFMIVLEFFLFRSVGWLVGWLILRTQVV